MIKLRNPAICRSRWFTPLICLGLGVVVFAVSALGGQMGGGLIFLAVLAGFGLIMLLLGSRSETGSWPSAGSPIWSPSRSSAGEADHGFTGRADRGTAVVLGLVESCSIRR
jgi:hypothetical protein